MKPANLPQPHAGLSRVKAPATSLEERPRLPKASAPSFGAELAQAIAFAQPRPAAPSAPAAFLGQAQTRATQASAAQRPVFLLSSAPSAPSSASQLTGSTRPLLARAPTGAAVATGQVQPKPSATLAGSTAIVASRRVEKPARAVTELARPNAATLVASPLTTSRARLASAPASKLPSITLPKAKPVARPDAASTARGRVDDQGKPSTSAKNQGPMHEEPKAALAPAQPPAPEAVSTTDEVVTKLQPLPSEAPAQLLTQATDDPSLRIAVLPRAAHIKCSVDGADVSLHLRIRDGVADVRVDGAAAQLLNRVAQLEAALATEGLQLGRFDLPQEDRGSRPPPDAEEAPARPRAGKRAEAASVSGFRGRGLHVKA